MTELGYALSSEEHMPNDLVRFAQRAEQAGFRFAMISDHYHPWISRMGNAPFVWSVIGGISQVTSRLRLGTGVTCPIMRIHPAIIAQASATAAAMLNGRFFLGLGSGEYLNEHILGEEWPPAEIRLEMLEEAIEIIRLLWKGEEESYLGDYFTVKDARLYSLPEQPPDIYVASAGPDSASLAAEKGDGLISVVPNQRIIQAFDQAGGASKPHYGQIKVCYAESEQRAREIVWECWPVMKLSGLLHSDLPTPAHFEDVIDLLDQSDLSDQVVYGPDPQKHLDAIQKLLEAGYDYIYLHQIGPNQEDFFQFYERQILPEFSTTSEPSS